MSKEIELLTKHQNVLLNTVLPQLNNLNQKMNSIENSNVELKVTLKFLEDQIKEHAHNLDDVKSIEHALKSTSENILKLETMYKEAIANNDVLIKQINNKLKELDIELQKLPLVFQEKNTDKKDILDYIKAIPSILTILGALGTGFYLWMQYTFK